MRRILIILFLSVYSQNSFSQGINKTLVIDTVIGEIDVFRASTDSTSPANIEIEAPLINEQHSNVFVATIRTHTSPNIILPLTASDTTVTLKLPLDDSGGVLALKRFFAVKTDTIRISKLRIYHNCLPDTIKRNLTWFKRNSKDAPDSLKILQREKYADIGISKDCIANYPERLVLLINGSEYRTPISTFKKPGFDMSVACGGHKKMSKWRERIYRKRIERGKPYKYFSYNSEQCHYGLFAEIALSK